jgi:hypothetical protein
MKEFAKAELHLEDTLLALSGVYAELEELTDSAPWVVEAKRRHQSAVNHIKALKEEIADFEKFNEALRG